MSKALAEQFQAAKAGKADGASYPDDSTLEERQRELADLVRKIMVATGLVDPAIVRMAVKGSLSDMGKERVTFAFKAWTTRIAAAEAPPSRRSGRTPPRC